MSENKLAGESGRFFVILYQPNDKQTAENQVADTAKNNFKGKFANQCGNRKSREKGKFANRGDDDKKPFAALCPRHPKITNPEGEN